MERNIVIADTGFLVALLNQSDKYHIAVKLVYAKQLVIILPQTVLAEVAYLVGQAAGISAVATFLRSLPATRFQLTALNEADMVRIAEILEQYADSRIDFVDASGMAMAERHMIATILTLDQRDFRLFRPRHCQSFELLP